MIGSREKSRDATRCCLSPNKPALGDTNSGDPHNGLTHVKYMFQTAIVTPYKAGKENMVRGDVKGRRMSFFA